MLSTQDSSTFLTELLEDVTNLDELKARVQSLSPEARRQLLDIVRREKAQDSDQHYVEYVHAEQLTDGDGTLPPHILELYAFFDECYEHKEHGLGLLPRGSSKTTSFTIGKSSKLIAKNPDIRIGLFSNTATQAEAFSRAIRTTISENDRHLEIYETGTGSPKWTDAEWIHPKSRHKKGSKDVTVYAQGVGGAIISKRFDIIICDDILDEENTSSPLQMEKTETWFWKTLKPCLVPGGIFFVVGTRWAEGDLYQTLLDPKDQGGKAWRALIKSAIVFDENGDEQSYWPERWTLADLEKEREDMGSALFACAYMNDISGLMKGNVFHPLPPDHYFSTLPEGRRYTYRMGVDLASSEKERADFTARVVSAQDDEGNFFVLSAYRDKREDHHAEFIYDGYLAYPEIDLVICENNQFQSTLIKTVMKDYPQVPIEGRKSDKDKTSRARAVAAKYEGHKVFHHTSLRGSDFERELLMFPKGHDDMVDALGFSMDLAGGGFFFGTLGRRAAARQ